MRKLLLAVTAMGACALIGAPAAFAHPPNCANARANPSILWPPNHKFHKISIVGVTSDAGTPKITILGVTQDEPLDALGDGSFAPDAQLGPNGSSVSVRAERSGLGDGRVYRITFKAKNTIGYCTGSVTVGVPHDQGAHSTPIDSGQAYDSLG
jgi:hypothetical protein